MFWDKRKDKASKCLSPISIVKSLSVEVVMELLYAKSSAFFSLQNNSSQSLINLAFEIVKVL